ncbi:hypothetical protein FHEFKHOI_00432 [Candidatus Methanoperedenaceae archaeon GB50]|nr:hypothetical protein AIOGIFDO_00429 [Candidatus Methanoperedenaceae archaeon GB37]CAD7768829.1 hypothetical protein FHEFKHOI_00432 [Candidatus Methanoperedenaceae archaeon GB50]
MQINQLRKEYIEHVAEFDKKIESEDIIEENGKFYEKEPSGNKIGVLRPTYSEWLLERLVSQLQEWLQE